MSSRKTLIHRIATFSTGVALGLSILSGAASADTASSQNSSGNTGTIKVDGIDYDDTPGNEPHVGCSFQIDFFGFDLGDRADIRFFAQPPSGEGQLLHEDLDVLVSDDPAAGGPNDVDETVPYDAPSWDLSALTPSAQGYHVKVEANVVDAPGGSKQKVFWIDCPPVVTVPPVPPVVVVLPVPPVVTVPPVPPVVTVVVVPPVPPVVTVVVVPPVPPVVTMPPVPPVVVVESSVCPTVRRSTR